jgi:hypothetical protein
MLVDDGRLVHALCITVTLARAVSNSGQKCW